MGIQEPADEGDSSPWCEVEPAVFLRRFNDATDMGTAHQVLYDTNIDERFSVGLFTVSLGPDVKLKGCMGFYLNVDGEEATEGVLRRSAVVDSQEFSAIPGNRWALRVDAFAGMQNPAAAHVPARPLRTKVNTPEASKQIWSWLSTCRTHENCQDVIQQAPPSGLYKSRLDLDW